MAYIPRTYFSPYGNNEPHIKSTKLVQHKCPNCGAKLDTRRFVPDGYEVDKDGGKHFVYAEQKYVKCDFCRSEFELIEEEK